MRRWLGAIGVCTALLVLGIVHGEGAEREGRVTRVSKAGFDETASALKQAIQDHKMGLVCHANAQAGAASRGVKIRGNQVFMIFRPDFAIRMLKANVEAGFEAPMRIYLSENADGTATVTYIRPSALFKPYGSRDLDTLGLELDGIFEKIVAQALGLR